MEPNEVFSIAPIPGQREALPLFKGRISELHVLSLISRHRSEHALIVGEIAVGKSSLANVLGPTLAEHSPVDIRHAICATSTTFASMWNELLPAFRPWPEEMRPNDVAARLKGDTHMNRVFVIDELDVLADAPFQALADLVRRVSDERLPMTFVLVGARKVQERLFKAHQSLNTFVKVVPLLRMPLFDLETILIEGFKKLQINFNRGHVRTMALLSMGLPRAVHSLGLYCAEYARRDNPSNTEILPSHVDRAIRSFANSDTQLRQFQRWSKPLYDVLVACAMTAPDAHGTFRAGATARALSELTGQARKSSDFYDEHLSTLRETGIIEVEKLNREIRFRFKNPWQQPVILTDALTDALSPRSLDLATFRRCHDFEIDIETIWSEISECANRSVEAFDTNDFDTSEAYFERAAKCLEYVTALEQQESTPDHSDPGRARIREIVMQLQNSRKGPVD
jgi:hypothetical protein